MWHDSASNPANYRARDGWHLELRDLGRLQRAKIDDLDYDYYVENQILPVAARALEVFGIGEQQILPVGQKQGTLG